jgi:hypothetical protein
MKTSELTGAALDWAVAKCEGQTYHGPAWTKPSTDWAQGGPIIERERIEVRPYDGVKWIATDNLTNHTVGTTPLIAAMRCYVASKLGDEVEIPEELNV